METSCVTFNDTSCFMAMERECSQTHMMMREEVCDGAASPSCHTVSDTMMARQCGMVSRNMCRMVTKQVCDGGSPAASAGYGQAIMYGSGGTSNHSNSGMHYGMGDVSMSTSEARAVVGAK